MTRAGAISKLGRGGAALLIALVAAVAATGLALGQGGESFSPHVSADGTIRLPADFRAWTALGTWAVASGEEEGGASDFHVVYAEPQTVAAFRATGRFPDGAVIVKELFEARTGDMTTGRVSHAHRVSGWFIMVKDTKGRFPEHKLWGEGWGWALIEADDPSTIVTTDYREDCLGCHIPAQATDWIYLEGYPVLR